MRRNTVLQYQLRGFLLLSSFRYYPQFISYCVVYMLKVAYREGIHDHYKHFQQVPTIDIVVKSPAGVIARILDDAG